jgi:hypothetical protein
MLARGKHSSSLQTLVNYDRKKFYNNDTRMVTSALNRSCLTTATAETTATTALLRKDVSIIFKLTDQG